MVKDNEEHSEHVMEEQHQSLLDGGARCHFEIECLGRVKECVFFDESLDAVPLASQSHFFSERGFIIQQLNPVLFDAQLCSVFFIKLVFCTQLLFVWFAKWFGFNNLGVVSVRNSLSKFIFQGGTCFQN